MTHNKRRGGFQTRPPTSHVPRPPSTVPAWCAVFASAAALAIRRASRRAAIQCRERNIRMFRSRHWIA
ncbi:MAG: hypothetical protein LBM98_09085 [Oscillospiraceae bacterium]|nr:hypothetical protein [Oscillospiraceae bacterium]